MSGIIGMARALDFAARRHAGQRRKGLNAEPYVNHLTEVALLLADDELKDPVVVKVHERGLPVRLAAREVAVYEMMPVTEFIVH